jgi:hypothetical protein
MYSFIAVTLLPQNIGCSKLAGWRVVPCTPVSERHELAAALPEMVMALSWMHRESGIAGTSQDSERVTPETMLSRLSWQICQLITPVCREKQQSHIPTHFGHHTPPHR